MSQSRYLNSPPSDAALSGFSSWNPQAAAFVPFGLEVLGREYSFPNDFMLDPRVPDFTPHSLGFSPANMESVGARPIDDVPHSAQDIFEDIFAISEPAIDPPEVVQGPTDIPFVEPDQSESLRAPTKKKTVKAVARAEDILAASIAEKQRLAAEVIKEQEGEAEEAKRLGQDIRIVTIDGCPEIEGIYWKAPENDDSIPKTPAAKKACFDQVYAAILDTTDCKEVTTKKAFKSRWGPEKTHYLEGDLIRVGWKVVKALVAIHEDGWTTDINDPALRNSIQTTMFYTFKDRLDGVVKLLTKSKSTCEAIAKGEKFWVVVGNPLALDTRTSSNQASNKRKGDRLKRVREEEVEGEAEAAAEGRPRRTKRLRTRRA